MEKEMKIHFRLGGALEEEFCNYWNAEVSGASDAILPASYLPAKKAQGGPAFALPPEAIVILQKMGEAAMLAAASGFGKFLWDRLRKFLQKTETAKTPQVIIVIIGGKKVTIQPREMPENPSEEFLALFQ